MSTEKPIEPKPVPREPDPVVDLDGENYIFEGNAIFTSGSPALRTQGKNYSARVNFIADISDMSPGELGAVEAAFAKFRGARAEDRPAHRQRILDMVAKYGPVAVAAAKAWFETHHH